MKTIATVNTEIPGIKGYCSFDSGQSLHDYDIVLFNPQLPYYDRHSFSDGSSAIDRTDGQRAIKSIRHWENELTNALKEGKTVFFLLADRVHDTYVTGISSSTAKTAMYSTSSLSNYGVMPFTVELSNSKGSKVQLVDGRFKSLFEALEGHIKYRAYLNDEHKTPIAKTYTGNKALGAIYRLKGYAGHMVLLPYFSLSSLTETNAKGEEMWTKVALGIGTKLFKSLKELDKVLTQQSDRTPEPSWIESVAKSKKIATIEVEIQKINKEIEERVKAKEVKNDQLSQALNPTALLYETGKPLERAIEAFLSQLGYNVTNFREGSLEIDHIIVSPEGKRLIGEAEGKDNSAVNIEKFRQLESNINEDFQREEVMEPAGGLLFGNGYRLKSPDERGVQFTDKCLINAKRLSTVLIQTSDLFPISMYLQDNPDDEEYKKECRKVIESANGEIAQFPLQPIHKEK